MARGHCPCPLLRRTGRLPSRRAPGPGVRLGRLARYLRLAGFDTLYRNEWRDGDIVALALREGRTILTRDRGLLKRDAVTHGYLVRSGDPRRQLAEVVERFDLGAALQPFTICPVCNERVEKVDKAEVAGSLPPHTAQTQEEFRRCPACGRVYWRGSHHRRIGELLADLGSGDAGS